MPGLIVAIDMAMDMARTLQMSEATQLYDQQRLREIFGKMATKAMDICQVDIFFTMHLVYEQFTNICPLINSHFRHINTW